MCKTTPSEEPPHMFFPLTVALPHVMLILSTFVHCCQSSFYKCPFFLVLSLIGSHLPCLRHILHRLPPLKGLCALCEERCPPLLTSLTARKPQSVLQRNPCPRLSQQFCPTHKTTAISCTSQAEIPWCCAKFLAFFMFPSSVCFVGFFFFIYSMTAFEC